MDVNLDTRVPAVTMCAIVKEMHVMLMEIVSLVNMQNGAPAVLKTATVI